MAPFRKGTLPIVLLASALSGLAGYFYGVNSSPANAKSRQVMPAGRAFAPVWKMRPDTGQPDQPCSPDQLSGQYECVTSVPLSEEEVRVSMAYLAALRRSTDTSPVASGIAAFDSVRR